MAKYDANKDYYRVLGIKEGASKEDINKAYRNEARRRHPDSGGSEDEMKSLNEAHDILSDPAARNAYDAERRANHQSYGSSMVYADTPTAFDPDSASKAGTLKITVQDEDFAGLLMGAAACFGLGLPLLLLIEMQWMFFLWPLRLLSLGALGLGVLMSHSALAVKHGKGKRDKSIYSRGRVILHEVAFWSVACAGLSLLILALYTNLLR